MRLGSHPWNVAVSPSGGRVYVPVGPGTQQQGPVVIEASSFAVVGVVQKTSADHVVMASASPLRRHHHRPFTRDVSPS